MFKQEFLHVSGDDNYQRPLTRLLEQQQHIRRTLSLVSYLKKNMIVHKIIFMKANLISKCVAKHMSKFSSKMYECFLHEVQIEKIKKYKALFSPTKKTDGHDSTLHEMHLSLANVK